MNGIEIKEGIKKVPGTLDRTLPVPACYDSPRDRVGPRPGDTNT